MFVEVPGQSDFGKDGYVDIATGVGAVTGACFAVQIKGGRSYRRGDGYRIDGTEANRRLWASSTLPVLGIVWDPDEERLAWLDLTAVLNDAGVNAELHVPAVQHLGDESAIRRFRKYVGSTAHRAASVLDLASRDVDMQLAAVAASYHIGRTDGRALILLRRLMFSLERAAQRSAVWALASAIPHPDIFGSAEGSPDPAAEALLEPTLRWSVVEVVDLLGLMDEEGGFDVQDELRPIFVGLIDALVVRVGERVQQGERADKPLLVLLDEDANSAPLTKLPQYAATLRSRDVQLVTIFQDYGQVVRRWGRDNARSILNNHVARVLLPGMADPDLLEIFSNLVGERQAVSTTVSEGAHGPSTSETRRWERLAPVSELRTLPAGHAVLIHDNTPPAKVRLRPYYRETQWRDLGGWLERTAAAQ